MAISANYSWSGDVAGICRRSMQLAGLLPLGRNIPAEQQGHVIEHLQDTCKALRARGVGLTQWENTTLTLTAGVDGQVSTTSLPADTVSVEFPMMIAVTGETSQQQVTRMVWEQYQEITNKTTQGKPLRAYVEVTHSVSVKWWPVPNAAYTVSYRRERLHRDADSGATLDLRPHWNDAIVYTMAHKMALAGSLGAERCRMLREEAETAIELAKGREHEGGDIQVVIDMGYY